LNVVHWTLIHMKKIKLSSKKNLLFNPTYCTGMAY
jgi:hypothetical protein